MLHRLPLISVAIFLIATSLLQPAMADQQQQQQQQQQPQQQQQQQQAANTTTPLLALPAASDVPSRSINVGESLALDELGPIIIQEDGTTARITNWDTLCEREKEITRRRIAKRNAERIAALAAQGLIPSLPYSYGQSGAKQEGGSKNKEDL